MRHTRTGYVNVRKSDRGRILNQSFGFVTPREIAEGPLRVRGAAGPIFLETRPRGATGVLKVYRDGQRRLEPELGGLGEYSDYWWFVEEVNKAKAMAARTGDVDGAKSLVDRALVIFQKGPHPVPDGDYQSPPDFAANAKAYIEGFRRGSEQLAVASSQATGAQQAYYASPEQQRLAAEERETEATSLEVAQGPFSFMYEAAPFWGDPTGFAARDTVVERATGAPAGAGFERAAKKAGDAAKKLGGSIGGALLALGIGYGVGKLLKVF